MTASGGPERRYVIERRLVRDRRRGLDRRIVDRRVQFQWAAFERRLVPDQRRGLDRRHPLPRRGRPDRRAAALSSAGPPSA